MTPLLENGENARMRASRWKALIVISIIQFVLLLDATIVNVALPKIKHDLAFTDASLTWVMNAYLVAAGSLLLFGGRVGDAFGLRRMLQLGITIFGAFSLLAAFAPNATVLLVGRAGQGIGEALAAATGLAMVSLLFPSGPERGKAFAIWASLGGIGSIIGVILSGLLTEYLSWRWVFGINVPIILILAVATVLLVPQFSDKRRVRLDMGNALILMVSVFILAFSMIGSGIEQHFLLRVALFLFGVLGITIVLRRCKKTENAIIPARLMTRSPRLIGYAIVAVLAGTSGALFYLGVLLLQDFLNMAPLQAGFAWLPFCISFFVGIFLFQFVSQKWCMRAAALVGIILSAIGFMLFAMGVLLHNYWIGMMPAMFITASGFGCVAPVAQSLATMELTEADAGVGSGITTTIQQLFQVGGLSFFVTVATAITGGVGSSTIDSNGFIVTFVLAAMAMIGVAILVWVKRHALVWETP